MLDDRGARMVDGAFEEVKSALDIFVKDMGLVTGAARERECAHADGRRRPQELFSAGHRAGLGRLDDSDADQRPAGRMTSRPKRSIAASVSACDGPVGWRSRTAMWSAPVRLDPVARRSRGSRLADAVEEAVRRDALEREVLARVGSRPPTARTRAGRRRR